MTEEEKKKGTETFSTRMKELDSEMAAKTRDLRKTIEIVKKVKSQKGNPKEFLEKEFLK